MCCETNDISANNNETKTSMWQISINIYIYMINRILISSWSVCYDTVSQYEILIYVYFSHVSTQSCLTWSSTPSHSTIYSLNHIHQHSHQLTHAAIYINTLISSVDHPHQHNHQHTRIEICPSMYSPIHTLTIHIHKCILVISSKWSVPTIWFLKRRDRTIL